MSHKVHVEPFCLGQWRTNCFVVHVEGAGRACWIVDAGFEPQPILDYVRQNDLQPSQILLTHAHLDHIAGLNELRKTWPDITIMIHEVERAFLTDPALNLSLMMPPAIVAPKPTGFVTHEQVLELEGIKFEVRHTPGHSPGGITLYQKEAATAIVGDTLFAGSIGRFDFPTSNAALLMKSIREQLLTLPDDTRIWPGHGPETTIGGERSTNPYVK